MHSTSLDRLTYARGLQLCAKRGYISYTQFPNGRDACIAKMTFTWALLADLDRSGYGERWCYPSLGAALLGLGRWMQADGEGEPQGWTRHHSSGRRRDGDPTHEYVTP